MPTAGLFADPTPEQVLERYGIKPGFGGAISFTPPSGTYPGRSYEGISSAYSTAALQYADALRNQAQAQATATPGATTPGATPGMPGLTPSLWGTSQTAAGTPAAGYTTANDADYLKSMSDLINQISMDAQQSANYNRIPGARGLEEQSSQNIGAALRGQLPSDVQYQIGQAAAQRGVSSGSPWGANTNADLLMNIGKNSLQMQGLGQDWLTGAYGRNPAAPIFDTSKLLITPAQAEQIAAQKRQEAFEQQRIDLERRRQEMDWLNRMYDRQLQEALNRRYPTGGRSSSPSGAASNYGTRPGGQAANTATGGVNITPTTTTSPTGKGKVTVNESYMPGGRVNDITGFPSDYGPTPDRPWGYGETPETLFPGFIEPNPMDPYSYGNENAWMGPSGTGQPWTGGDFGGFGGENMDFGNLSPDELIALYTGGY